MKPRKRSRIIIALLLPAIALMWVVGWTFYWIGHQKAGKAQTQPSEKKDGFTLIPTFTVEEERLAAA
jgi:flagellar basal body-associated protein FliL